MQLVILSGLPLQKEAPLIFAADGNVNLVIAEKLTSNDLLQTTFCKSPELFIRVKFFQLRQFLYDNLPCLSETLVTGTES